TATRDHFLTETNDVAISAEHDFPARSFSRRLCRLRLAERKQPFEARIGCVHDRNRPTTCLGRRSYRPRASETAYSETRPSRKAINPVKRSMVVPRIIPVP